MRSLRILLRESSRSLKAVIALMLCLGPSAPLVQDFVLMCYHYDELYQGSLTSDSPLCYYPSGFFISHYLQKQPVRCLHRAVNFFRVDVIRSEQETRNLLPVSRLFSIQRPKIFLTHRVTGLPVHAQMSFAAQCCEHFFCLVYKYKMRATLKWNV